MQDDDAIWVTTNQEALRPGDEVALVCWEINDWTLPEVAQALRVLDSAPRSGPPLGTIVGSECRGHYRVAFGGVTIPVKASWLQKLHRVDAKINANVATQAGAKPAEAPQTIADHLHPGLICGGETTAMREANIEPDFPFRKRIMAAMRDADVAPEIIATVDNMYGEALDGIAPAWGLVRHNRDRPRVPKAPTSIGGPITELESDDAFRKRVLDAFDVDPRWGDNRPGQRIVVETASGQWLDIFGSLHGLTRRRFDACGGEICPKDRPDPDGPHIPLSTPPAPPLVLSRDTVRHAEPFPAAAMRTDWRGR